MTAFSFHPVKHITTGEGGAIATNDDDLATKLRIFRTHGITKDPSCMTREPDGPWYNEMVDLGYNYRLTDLQSALGLSQLKKLDRFIEARRRIASRYNELLGSISGVTVPASHKGHGYHLYPLRVPADMRKGLFEKLRSLDIGVQVHYPPVHLHPYYRKNYGYKEGDFPVAERFYSMEISLPIYPDLSEDDQDRVVDAIRDYVADF